MSLFWKKLRQKREKAIERQVAQWNSSLEEGKVKPTLEENLEAMQSLFADVDLLRYKMIQSEIIKPMRYLLIFCDGIVDSEIINVNIVRPLMSIPPQSGVPIEESLVNDVIHVGEIKTTDSFQNVIESVTYGDSILFAEGSGQAIIMSTKNFSLRSIAEPDSEKSLVGPREGFTESLTRNLSQVMRRLRTHELKCKMLTMGRRTKTTVCVTYLDSMVKHELLDELMRRLSKIDIDGVLDSNYITELIRDHPGSPFRTIGYTERPDSVVGKLLEGRIAIFVDGSPMVITAPYLFIENFQSSEDYYLNSYYTSFARFLRICAFLLTVLVPGLYVAVVAFHQEMLPLQLLIRIALERQSVPLPAAVEAVVMLVVFDVLRETGIRMPSNIGQALSIVGALVIGQAAVEASLVAAPMIIVVAATGITGLLVPRLNAPIILFRIIILLMSSAFGFFGLTISFSLMLIHIYNLTSLGIDQVAMAGNFRAQTNKDIIIRAPWKAMLRRPPQLTDNTVRQKEERDG